MDSKIQEVCASVFNRVLNVWTAFKCSLVDQNKWNRGDGGGAK